jgi:hypothetical protein
MYTILTKILACHGLQSSLFRAVLLILIHLELDLQKSRKKALYHIYSKIRASNVLLEGRTLVIHSEIDCLSTIFVIGQQVIYVKIQDTKRVCFHFPEIYFCTFAPKICPLCTHCVLDVGHLLVDGFRVVAVGGLCRFHHGASGSLDEESRR